MAVPADVCGDLAIEMERLEEIPAGLVQAVALAESGRWSDARRNGQPWPWTVTSGADSYFLPTKAAALAKVRELQALGRTNIDVGCMQVNLGYHGDAFGSLEEALDPVRNVAYGARFLKQLSLETRSWSLATARYHSNDPQRGRAYHAKVYRLWQQLRPGQVPMAGVGPRRLVGTPEAQSDDQGSRARLWSPSHDGTGQRGAAAIAILRGN